MKKRALGQSDIEISELSLGCMSLPTRIQEVKSVIDTALDAGINYFDTADLYDKGLNEQLIGEALKPYRHEIILATKVGNRWQEGKDGWTWDPSPSHIENGLKDSLRRLQTDYIDVYQLHGGTKDDPWDEIIDTFDRLKKEGLIREYGISSIRRNVFVPFLQESKAVSNMMQFNLLDRCAEEWFAPIRESGASVVTRGSIAKGLLTNEWRARISSYGSYNEQELTGLLQELSEHYGDLHALAFAFNLHFKAVASTVIGARSSQQLLSNIAAYEKATSINDLSFAFHLLKKDTYKEHR
ncbi:aldo/keto reductase [Lysinibacillus sp. 54212]|uniref:aldo/keto reductase n=1 Tax=Lysinibacillus sp. 54212 TaxID=3119829 RepID=UPI002FC6537C